MFRTILCLCIHKLFEICIAQVELESEGKNSSVVIHKLVVYNYHIKSEVKDGFLKTGQYIGLWSKLLTCKQVILFIYLLPLFIFTDYGMR